MPPRKKTAKGDPQKGNKHRIYMKAVKMKALKRMTKGTKHRNPSRLCDALATAWVRKNAVSIRARRIAIPAEFFN